MGIKFEAMKTVGDYIRNNCKDEKVVAAWSELKFSYTGMISDLLNIKYAIKQAEEKVDISGGDDHGEEEKACPSEA